VALAHELPGVGKNLQDHLQVRSVYKSRLPTINDAVRSPLGLLKMACEFVLARRGPLTMAPTPVIALGRSVGTAEATPDVQIHFGPWTARSRETGFWGMSPFRVLDGYSAFTMTTCQLRPHSRGEVRLRPGAAEGAPLIIANYLADPRDVARPALASTASYTSAITPPY
jgi:choline dehydrogenase